MEKIIPTYLQTSELDKVSCPAELPQWIKSMAEYFAMGMITTQDVDFLCRLRGFTPRFLPAAYYQYVESFSDAYEKMLSSHDPIC